MLRNFGKQIAPLIGILIISVGAFFGFGSIFSYLDIGLGAQALTAAFGALFIILSTKFLMDTESASSLKREKDREKAHQYNRRTIIVPRTDIMYNPDTGEILKNNK